MFFSWEYPHTAMKWALSAFLSSLIDGLELSQQVNLLSPRNVCSPMSNWTRIGLCWRPRALLPQKAATGHLGQAGTTASLPQGPHPSHGKAGGSWWRDDLPADCESSPMHSSEMWDLWLQALCHGWGRCVACQAGWKLPLKWFVLLSAGVHCSLSCIINWHQQQDTLSIRNA